MVYAIQLKLNPSKIVHKNSVGILEGAESTFGKNNERVMPFGTTIAVSIY
jgi:hypothetical protein